MTAANADLLPALLTGSPAAQRAFDNKAIAFYDLIFRLTHKSVRGSTPDTALYWYARIITAGGVHCTWRVAARRGPPRKMWYAVRARDAGHIAAWDCFTRVVRLKAKGAIALSYRLSRLLTTRRNNAAAFKAALADARTVCPDYDVLSICVMRRNQTDERDGLWRGTAQPLR